MSEPQVCFIEEGSEFDFIVKHNKLEFIVDHAGIAVYKHKDLLVLYRKEDRIFSVTDSLKNPTRNYVLIWSDILYCFLNGVDLMQVTLDRFYIND